jgi:hypothetical protein
MNEKNPDRLSILMDLGLSLHYAQVLTMPLICITRRRLSTPKNIA